MTRHSWLVIIPANLCLLLAPGCTHFQNPAAGEHTQTPSSSVADPPQGLPVNGASTVALPAPTEIPTPVPPSHDPQVELLPQKPVLRVLQIPPEPARPAQAAVTREAQHVDPRVASASVTEVKAS